jgi:hypothetical protein
MAVQEECISNSSLELLQNSFLLIYSFNISADYIATEIATVSLNYLRINQLKLMRQIGQPHHSSNVYVSSVAYGT